MTSPKNILEALELEALSSKEQEEVLLQLNELVFRGALVRTIEHMDDKAREDFGKLLEKDPSEEELHAFLKSRAPGADNAVAETVRELTDDILAVTSKP